MSDDHDTMTDDEMAIRAALNVLRDSVEAGRMPSGLPLAPDAREAHRAAIAALESMLQRIRGTACNGIEP